MYTLTYNTTTVLKTYLHDKYINLYNFNILAAGDILKVFKLIQKDNKYTIYCNW